MQKDFITVTPDSGNGDGTITVSVSENTGEARSSSITISGSGMTKVVDVSQEKGIIVEEYFLDVENSYENQFYVTFTSSESNSKTVKVISYKKVTINAVEKTEDVSWTFRGEAQFSNLPSFNSVIRTEISGNIITFYLLNRPTKGSAAWGYNLYITQQGSNKEMIGVAYISPSA